MHTLILQKDHINQIINHVGINKIMDDCIRELHAAYLNFNSTEIQMKKRDGFIYNNPYPGVFEWMPIRTSDNLALIKLVSYNPENPNIKQIPTILSQISLIDTTTGHLLALMDGGITTAIRTGAASAIASRLMASRDSSVLGLIGCGCQSITQLHALLREFPLEKVYIYDVDELTVNSFMHRARSFNVIIESIELERLIAESDIICTATSVDVEAGPVVKSLAFKPHLHINAVGADLPGKIEISKEILKLAYVCPDFVDQALVEGECQQLRREELGKDIISLVKDKKDIDQLKRVLTVYDSTGIPLQDLIITKQFVNAANELKIGNPIELENITANPKDPYININMK